MNISLVSALSSSFKIWSVWQSCWNIWNFTTSLS